MRDLVDSFDSVLLLFVIIHLPAPGVQCSTKLD
jgi:hypothetical protein